MKIKTNLDWIISRYHENIGNALAFKSSYGVTKHNEVCLCLNDLNSNKTGFLLCKEGQTYPSKERMVVLNKNFCQECIFRKECKKANKTNDFYFLNAEKVGWIYSLHEWPIAKTKRSFKFAHGITIPKGRLVKVVEEQKTDLLTVDENGNKVPIEFYYIISYKDDLYSVLKEDIEFKENYAVI